MREREEAIEEKKTNFAESLVEDRRDGLPSVLSSLSPLRELMLFVPRPFFIILVDFRFLDLPSHSLSFYLSCAPPLSLSLSLSLSRRVSSSL